jgi:hypothetical protein
MPVSDEATTAASANDKPKNMPDLFKTGHVVQISLRTFQDVIQFKKWIRTAGSPTRLVLSHLKFTFRAVYDGANDITTINIMRGALAKPPRAQHDEVLSLSLGFGGEDLKYPCIPARLLSKYDEVAQKGDVWISRFVTFESKNLNNSMSASFQWYRFFREFTARKEGKDWDVADLEKVVDFLLDYRGRCTQGA